MKCMPSETTTCFRWFGHGESPVLKLVSNGFDSCNMCSCEPTMNKTVKEKTYYLLVERLTPDTEGGFKGTLHCLHPHFVSKRLHLYKRLHI